MIRGSGATCIRAVSETASERMKKAVWVILGAFEAADLLDFTYSNLFGLDQRRTDRLLSDVRKATAALEKPQFAVENPKGHHSCWLGTGNWGKNSSSSPDQDQNRSENPDRHVSESMYMEISACPSMGPWISRLSWLLFWTISVPLWLHWTCNVGRLQQDKLKTSQTGFLHRHQISVKQSSSGMWWSKTLITDIRLASVRSIRTKI